MPSQLTLRQLVSLALLLSLASPFVSALPTLQARDGAAEALSVLAAVSQELVQVVNPKISAKLNNSTVALSKNVALPVYYSALVAVGASYTDNGHARAAQYSSSLRNYYPYSKFGGKYSNGMVAVEYMVDSNTSPALKRSGSNLPKLLDYAYGGSVVQNGLSGTGSSSPAAVNQISAYLSDVKSGSAALGSGRVLHYFNSGINSQYQIWNAALSAGLSDASIANAHSATLAQVSALAAAIRTIGTSSALALKAHGVDYLIVGLPSLELVPTSAYQVPSYFSAEKKSKALNLLETITAQYNDGLKSFAAQLKAEVKGAGGRVYFYDLASLWRDMHQNPKTYGITISPVTKTCYDSKTGSLCTDPSVYLYFDTLHPVTSVHAIIAKKVNALVLGL